MAAKHSFEDATAVRATSSHTYDSFFPDDWCIGSVPHGGYVTSVFLRVAQAHFSTTLEGQRQPNTVSLHLEFLRRTSTGPASFTVRDVKLGRQTSTVHVSLSQGSREEVVGYITNTNFSSEAGPTLVTDWTLHPPAPPTPLFDQLAATGDDGNWSMQRHMPFPNFRKAATKLFFYFPRSGQTIKGVADEWITWATPDPDKLSTTTDLQGERRLRFTDASIGYVCDAWPQIIETHTQASAAADPYAVSGSNTSENTAAKFWYPTLLLNLEIKKSLPPEGVDWLFVRVGAKKIEKGRYDLEVTILDEDGDLVALSHHVAYALPASRNLARRNNGGKQPKL